MPKNPKEGKLIYHLTTLENFKNIMEEGIYPRSDLDYFDDIADDEIINFRELMGLNEYVPFHFFSKCHFQGSVEKANIGTEFVLIAVKRSHARSNGYCIIPAHPLSCSPFKIYDYDEGFNLIDWDEINKFDYKDQECKNAGLAECLKHGIVNVDEISHVYCRNDKTTLELSTLYEDSHISFTTNGNMFALR